MTQVSQIIKDAYRETNLIAEQQSPSAYQQSEGLRLLQRLVDSTVGTEIGELFIPIPIGSEGVESSSRLDYPSSLFKGSGYLPKNARIVYNPTEAETLNLPIRPDDGTRLAVINPSANASTYPLTLKGNGATIEGASEIVLNTDAIDRRWIYRSDLGGWVHIAELETPDEMPFAREFDDYFIIGLAMRVNPRNSVPMTAESMEAYRRAKKRLRSRYDQQVQMTPEQALVRLPSSGRNHNEYYDHLDLFSQGFVTWPFSR